MQRFDTVIIWVLAATAPWALILALSVALIA